MNRVPLKDDQHHILGYVETKPNGHQTLSDDHHRIVGYYDPKTDYTTDDHHKVIGHGNLFTTLIKK
jgi:hypothetical protein